MTAQRDPAYVADERRSAPVVREWSSLRGGRTQHAQDRAALCRVLWKAGLAKHEIAEVLGVHWARIEPILSGVER